MIAVFTPPKISFAFQAMPKSSAHFTTPCFGVFCKIFVDFWVSLGVVKFGEIRNSEDLLNCEVKSTTNLECSWLGSNCLLVFQK